MTRLIPFALCAALAAPAAAQEAEGPGFLGGGGLLGGLLDGTGPTLDELTGIGAELLPTFTLLAREMGPAFAEVIGQVDAIANYEPPAFLPNGDIILRRREGAPAWTPPEAEAEAAPETEL